MSPMNKAYVNEKNSSPEDSQLQVTDNVPVFSAEEERRIYRRIDRRLVPILSLTYLLSVMDRTNVGNAVVEGLLKQLKMSSGDLTVALFMFFIPYCLVEPASNLVIKYFRPSRYLPTISFAWGVIMTLMGLVKTYPQFVGVRVCLGIVEAGLAPGVLYFLTFWYPRHMIQYRFGQFFAAGTVSGALSGVLAYGISFMADTRGLEGWSWIFIFEGIITVAVAIIAAFVLRGCDSPNSASFLTAEERSFITHRRMFGMGRVPEDESYKREYIIKAVTDWQLWIHCLILLSITVPLGACALFLPSIISGFGYTHTTSQLLTIPIYVFAAIVLLLFAHYSDKLKLRSPFVFVAQCMALIGFIINITNAPRGPKYFGLFLAVGGAYAAIPGSVTWLGNNLAPTYKRGVAVGIQIGIGNVAGVIATVVYRSKDEPRYILGHAVSIGFLIMGLIILPLTVMIYRHINASRDALAREDGDKYSDEEHARMGDRSPDFRYIL